VIQWQVDVVTREWVSVKLLWICCTTCTTNP